MKIIPFRSRVVKTWPALAADVQGADRIVEHGVSGYILPQNPQAWAEAMAELIDDPQKRERMGRAAREKIIREYSIEVWADKLEQIYAEL